MLGDYREFVEHEEVCWRCGGDVDDVQVGRGVVEGVEVFLWCWSGCFEFGDGLLCERGTVTQLEL